MMTRGTEIYMDFLWCDIINLPKNILLILFIIIKHSDFCDLTSIERLHGIFTTIKNVFIKSQDHLK